MPDPKIFQQFVSSAPSAWHIFVPSFWTQEWWMGFKRGSSSWKWLKEKSQAGNTEVEMANVEKANEFHCLWARKAGGGEVVYWKLSEQAWWSGEWRVCIQPSRAGRMDFSEGLIMWSAEHPALFQVTKPLRTRSEVSLKITLHQPHTDWSKPWGMFPVVSVSFGKVWSQQMYNSWLWNLLQKIRELCHRRVHSNIPALTTTRLLMKVVTRRCQKSAPLTPLPPALSPARIWIKPWRELSVRDDFPVIIAWVRDDALFFCKLPYLQSRTHWAHVQLIHSSSNSRSNYRVRCKFNYSTCRKQKQNLIVKFVLLRRKDKKQKKMLKWPVWAEYISLPRAGEKWTLFLLQKPHWIEFSFFFFPFLFPIQSYDVLLKLLPHLHVYVQSLPLFQGVFWDYITSLWK